MNFIPQATPLYAVLENGQAVGIVVAWRPSGTDPYWLVPVIAVLDHVIGAKGEDLPAGGVPGWADSAGVDSLHLTLNAANQAASDRQRI